MLDNGKILKEVPEKVLETVIPQSHELVLILTGEYRGNVGRIVKKETERVIVQLTDDLDILDLHFDEVSQIVQ